MVRMFLIAATIMSYIARQSALSPLRNSAFRTAWEKSGRPGILREWERTLGPVAEKPPKPEWAVVEEETVPSVIRRRIMYRVEMERWTEAYLLLPKGRKSRAPGVVVFHSTAPENIRQPAGVEGEADKFIGLRLAERGYVALCPRCYIYDDPARSFGELAADVPKRHPGWTGMRQMLWDGQRALDLLASLPEVDPKRLGAIGHSLGAKETLYLAAFDPRVKSAVFSEGGIGMRFTNWDADWYLGPQAKQPGFPRDHHELLALCAPRPFLLIGGDSADGAATEPYVEAARAIFKLYLAPGKLGLLNHRKGHAFPAEAQSAAYDWLDRWLKGRRSVSNESAARTRRRSSRHGSQLRRMPESDAGGTSPAPLAAEISRGRQ
jgi:dienelactone hydrolase